MSEISRSKKLRLLKEQKNKCFYCETEIDINVGEYDHVNPKNRDWAKPKLFRKVRKDNVMACVWCNASKWAYPPILWKYRLQTYIDEVKREIKKRKRIIKNLNYLLSVDEVISGMEKNEGR